MTSLALERSLDSIFVCAWLIRFLFGCQSQSLLDFLDRTGRFLRGPAAQITSYYQQQHSSKWKGKAGFSEAWIYFSTSLLGFSSPKRSMQYSRQFEPRQIHHSNRNGLTGCVRVWVRARIVVCYPCVNGNSLSVCLWIVSTVCVQMSLQCLISSEMHSVMRWPAGVWFFGNSKCMRQIDKLAKENMGTILFSL